MPSKSYDTFKYNLTDVDRLITAYNTLKPTGQGKRGLGHLTRSTIFILCATWEQYVEEVTVEAARLFAQRLAHPNDLPEHARLTLGRRASGSKDELEPLNMAGDGWRDVYLRYMSREIERHNTPNTDNVTILFRDHLGVTTPVYQWWPDTTKEDLDAFVSLRGEIAHNGRAAARYVKFTEVLTYRLMVRKIAKHTDGNLGDYLAETLPNRRPWNWSQD